MLEWRGCPVSCVCEWKSEKQIVNSCKKRNNTAKTLRGFEESRLRERINERIDRAMKWRGEFSGKMHFTTLYHTCCLILPSFVHLPLLVHGHQHNHASTSFDVWQSVFGNEASCVYLCCLQHATVHKSMELAHCGFYSYVLGFVLITSPHMFSTIQCADNVCTDSTSHHIERRLIHIFIIFFSKHLHLFHRLFSMIRFRLIHFSYRKKEIEIKPKFLLFCASHCPIISKYKNEDTFAHRTYCILVEIIMNLWPTTIKRQNKTRKAKTTREKKKTIDTSVWRCMKKMYGIIHRIENMSSLINKAIWKSNANRNCNFFVLLLSIQCNCNLKSQRVICCEQCERKREKTWN